MIISVVTAKIWYLKNVRFLLGHPVYASFLYNHHYSLTRKQKWLNCHSKVINNSTERIATKVQQIIEFIASLMSPNTGKQRHNKGSTELYCLFIAADSIVDVISFIRHSVIRRQVLPNSAPVPATFEFPNPAPVQGRFETVESCKTIQPILISNTPFSIKQVFDPVLCLFSWHTALLA